MGRGCRLGDEIGELMLMLGKHAKYMARSGRSGDGALSHGGAANSGSEIQKRNKCEVIY